jgi:glycosyltransferase involved in cell wall biosynthesis
VSSNVSVVIPTYNGAKYIAAAIESIFAQTRLPDEIVVVDDCSTDDTLKVLQSLRGPVAIRILQLERNSGGPVLPMTKGFEACDTPFITTLDQDDRMLPNRIERQVGSLERHPEAVAAIGLLVKIDADGKPSPGDFVTDSRVRIDTIPFKDGAGCRLLDPAGVYAHVLSHGTLTIASSTTFRKSAWSKAGGFDKSLRVAWDSDISLKLTAVGPLAYIPDPIGDYRLHAANTSAQGTTTLREVLALKQRHLDRPLHAIDFGKLQVELRDGYFGLAYTESNRGQLLAAWRALSEARRTGMNRKKGFTESIKAILRALQANLKRS